MMKGQLSPWGFPRSRLSLPPVLSWDCRPRPGPCGVCRCRRLRCPSLSLLPLSAPLSLSLFLSSLGRLCFLLLLCKSGLARKPATASSGRGNPTLRISEGILSRWLWENLYVWWRGGGGSLPDPRRKLVLPWNIFCLQCDTARYYAIM